MVRNYTLRAETARSLPHPSGPQLIMPETSGTSKNDVSMFSEPVAMGFALEFAEIGSLQKFSE